MKIVAYIAQSLDGYIAGPNGELDWLDAVDNPEGSDFGFATFMDSVDALLMGRHTFETVASFDTWPYSKPVYVASNSLTRLPPEFSDKATLLKGDLRAMLKQLQAQNVERLYLDGGQLIQSALQAGLLTELIVTTIPILLGQGIPLFGQLPQRVKLTLLTSEVLAAQMVKSRYQVIDSVSHIA